ncbi:hypothetical protein AAMO2058_001453500 [Amorphochlora amoebiformis]
MRSYLALAVAVACMACVPPDCDRNDCGSCGNACCKLNFMFPKHSNVEVAQAINSTIQNGGPDGRYFASPLAEGVVGVAPLPPVVNVSFIGQAIHTTAKRIYNDTINFAVQRSTVLPTEVMVFSTSQIGGALCDAGQNFKNIVTVMKSVCKQLGVEFSYVHVDGSCPEPGQ